MYFKLAVAQHPMYLIIAEDTQCAERTPPWGAPDTASYIGRVRDNLAAVRRYPRLSLGFEWSAVELEMLSGEAPELVQEMRSLAAEGRVAFYNGTYAQPHLQTLGPESNLRQLEHGLRVYRELLGVEVRVYAHQEASLHDQMPQLLRAFGYRFAVAPSFFWTLFWLDPAEHLFHGVQGLRFVNGSEFASWQGLDGSTIPLYLCQWPDRAPADEAILGLLHRPPITVRLPDMQVIDDACLERYRDVDLVLLEPALERRIAEAPPRARARLITNWSYIEGIRAEELSRAGNAAEEAALCAESVAAMALALLGRKAPSTDPIWKEILKAQHHDVACFCGPELKAKSIARLESAAGGAARIVQEAAGAIAAQIDTHGMAQPFVLFNPLPHPWRGVIESSGTDGSRLFAELPGYGYAAVDLPARLSDQAAPLAGRLSFENRFYRAQIDEDGTVRSLSLPTGAELIAPGDRGNRIAATDSGAARRPQEASPDGKRQPLVPPPPGVALAWEAQAATVVRDACGIRIHVEGRLGEISGTVDLALYHEFPRIDIDWTFTFSHASIGTFFDDDSKLRVMWPLAFSGEIVDDIAFGVCPSLPDRPVFPVSWIDCADGEKGLAYLHRGTPRHWVSRNTITNLFAWGEETDAIGNRLERNRWFKSFDQRLDGRHTISAAVYPHAGDWQKADVIAAARAFTHPPAAVATTAHRGTLPRELTLMAFPDRSVEATSITATDGHLRCRLYAPRGDAAAQPRLSRLRASALRTLAGEAVEKLSAFQIAELYLEPDRKTPQ